MSSPSTSKDSTAASPSQVVRKFVLDRIEQQILKPGDPLPSEMEIARLLAIHRLTVNRVFGDFVREGVLQRKRGVGTFVAVAPPPRRSPAQQPDRLVGFLTGPQIDPFTDPVYARLLEYIRRHLMKAGYFLVPFGSVDDYRNAGLLIGETALPAPEVMVLFGSVNESAIELLRKNGKKPVCVCFSGGPPEFPHISVDEAADSRELTNHLLDLGHRQIVHLNGRHPKRLEARLEGFLSANEKRGLYPSFRYIVTADSLEFEAGYAAAANLVESKLPFTSVHAATDHLALGAINYLLQHSRRVPEEISVVGFDGLPVGQIHRPRLTSMEVDPSLLGEKTAEIVINLLAGRSPTPVPPLRSRFILGETTAPVNVS